jgi:hypothetical protein
VQDLKTILLVENHPNDVEPTLEASPREPLDYPYRRGRFAGREPAPPAVLLLDSRCPRWTDSRCRTVKADPALKPIPS